MNTSCIRASLTTMVFAALLSACGGGPDPQPSVANKSVGPEAATTNQSPSARKRALAGDSLSVTATALFNWAEYTYPELLGTKVADLSLIYEGVNYQVRQFSSGNYLGVTDDNEVYALGPATNHLLQHLGNVSAYADQVDADVCKVDPAACAGVVVSRITAHTRSLNVVARIANAIHGREPIDADDVRRIKMHGFNHLRVLVPLRLSMQGLADRATIQAFHETLHADLSLWLAEGIAVTLTPFAENDAEMASIVGSAAARSAFAVFLRGLAERYAAFSPRLLSFEVLNEPHSITGSVAMDCQFTACSPPAWRSIQAEFVQGIREVAPHHTIIVSAADFNNFPALVRFLPYDDPNLVYALHYYPAQVFTAQSAWEPEHGLRYPACMTGNDAVVDRIVDERSASLARAYLTENWRRDRMAQDLAQVAAWAEHYGVRVFLNEAASYALDTESRLRYVRDIRLIAESVAIPWGVWAVTDYYIRGWVAGDRLPVVPLLRGTKGMPWSLSEPECTGASTSRVDLISTLRVEGGELRIKVTNAGLDPSPGTEVRIALSPGVAFSVKTEVGACDTSRSVVNCRLGMLAQGANAVILVTTALVDARGVGIQVIAVSDGRELDERDNFVLQSLPDVDSDGLSDSIDDDRDDDGLPDFYEAEWGTARLDPADALLDRDLDGYSTLAEFQARRPGFRFGSNPFDSGSFPPASGSSLAMTVPLLTRSAGGTDWRALATVYNQGASTAANCSVVPLQALEGRYRFHSATATGVVDGPAFEPRTIAVAGQQAFVVVVEPTTGVLAESVMLRVDCDNTGPVDESVLVAP